MRQDVLAFVATPESLVWRGDVLYDPIGGNAVTLDGATDSDRRYWPYPFDRALLSPSGTYAVIYADAATKALVVPAEGLRELNRSYYCADAYEYPIAVGALPSGREVVVHCPDAYDRIAVDDLATGDRIAGMPADADDVFHSRLAVSPGGRYVLSAGWVWHPLGTVRVYDVATLAEPGLGPPGNDYVETACWLDDDTVVVSTDPEENARGEIGLWSVSGQEWLARNDFGLHTGPMHAFGDNVLALYEHPREIDPRTGTVVREWPHLPTGTRTGCLFEHPRQPPVPVAVDGARRRFAVATGSTVTVVGAG